jgi:hypothetical protein
MNARTRIVAVILLLGAACLAGFVASPRDMLASWLFAWVFVLGLSLGSLAMLMLHSLTGGPWGDWIRAPLLAAARLLPGVAVAWLPLALGVHLLYPWAGAGETVHARWWLNTPFFVVRSIAYLAVWTVLMLGWHRSYAASLSSASGRQAVLRWSAGGLVVYTLTVSLAAVDWIASLMPQWYSSGFGLVVGTAQMLGATALAVAWAACLHRHEIPSGEARQSFIDLGNLLLTFVMSWSYLAFVQFLIIWLGNLPREIAWYVPRVQTAWVWLGVLLVLFHFFVPLLILLFRRAKAMPQRLFAIAAALLVANLLDALWMVAPSLRDEGLRISYTDVIAVVALVGAWLAGWLLVLDAGDSSRSIAVEPAHG